MGNTFLNLPAPVGNGAGAAVDVSGMGAIKTVVVQGSWAVPLKRPTVTIEINNAAVSTDGSWAPVCPSFRGTGIQTFATAARWMRQRVSNWNGGAAPAVNVGSSDDGATFASLPVPSANGVGAAVDVSALPLLKTLQLGGRFSGSVILELAEDAAGTKWAAWQAMQAPGAQNQEATGYWARIKRVGVPTVDPYDPPVANLGASNPVPDSGGGSGSFTHLAVQDLEITPALTPAALVAGDNNDYDPLGFSTHTRIRVTPDAANSTITGMAAQADGEVRIIEVLSGGGTLTLSNQNAASGAANRFACPGGSDLVITGNGAAICVYDATTGRWRVDAVSGLSASSSTFQALAITPAISPAALAAGNTDNYAPVGFATTTRVRVSADAAGSTLTGLSAQTDGAVRILENIGGPLTLAHQNGGSLAANQFTCPQTSDLVIAPNGAAICVYDATSTKWRVDAVSGDLLNAIMQSLALTPALVPAALAAGNTNDYAPANLATTTRIRQATNAGGSTLTGLVAQGSGALRLIQNLGGGTLTFANENAGSAAPNRFTCPNGNVVIASGGAALWMYDATSARWVLVGASGVISMTALTLSTLTVNTTLDSSNGTTLIGFMRFQAVFSFNAPLSPAALAAGATNDYAPGGIISANILRLTPNGAGSTLNGISPIGVAGTTFLIANIGAANLTLANEAAGSAAAARFSCAGGVDKVIAAGGSVVIWYDSGSSRWRIIG